MTPHTNLVHNGDDADLGEITYKTAMVTKTAAYTLTAADSGKTFVANATASVVFTLPSTALGLVYTIYVLQLPATGAGTAVSPAAADKIIGNGFTAADDKDAINTAATDVVGDLIELTADGVDGWYVTRVVGIWARE